MTSVWHRLTTFLRTRPGTWAASAAVGIAAVLAGVLISLAVMSGPRGTGLVDEAGATPTASSEATPSAIPTPDRSASPTAAPSPSATASPIFTSAPSAITAPTASPAATPEPPPDCCPGPDWDLRGSWTALPPMPNAASWYLSDVISLTDGSLAVIRWMHDPETADPRDQVLAWSTASTEWVRVETEPIFSGTDSQFALAGDGRIYSYDNVIDPSTVPWTAEAFALADPSETYAGYGLDAGPDGRIYRPATSRTSETRFEIYDPATGARTRSSALAASHHYCVLGGDGVVFAVDMVGFASYRAETDEWTDQVGMPGDRDCVGAGLGPDGRLYVASMWGGDDIVAWDFTNRAWFTVQPPQASAGFRPRFVTGPDGRLWAIDPRESFVFDPDER